MTLYDIRGRLISKNFNNYLIDWNGKSPSKPQFLVKQFLKSFWVSMICFEEFPIAGSRMRVDILNATLKFAVEVHGAQHSSLHYFHKNIPLNYLNSIKRDVKKAEWLEMNGYKLIEIYENECKNLSQDFFKQKFGIVL